MELGPAARPDCSTRSRTGWLGGAAPVRVGPSSRGCSPTGCPTRGRAGGGRAAGSAGAAWWPICRRMRARCAAAIRWCGWTARTRCIRCGWPARRMRSALQAFARVLDRDRTGGLIGELAWLAGELAPARDTEVMFARFEEQLAGLPGELVLGPVRAELTRASPGAATEARARALAALDSDRYLAVLGAVDELLADPPFTRHAAREARVVLPREVAGRLPADGCGDGHRRCGARGTRAGRGAA